MPSYGYVAVNLAGKTLKGSIEAEDEARARAELKHRGLTPTSLKEQGLLNSDINLDFLQGKPSARDLGVMCRQFVSMNRAGVSMIETLKMLSEQTENEILRKAIKEVRVEVEKGDSLSSAFAKHPKVFPDLLVTMTAAGESSGSLDIAMERMSTHFEKAQKTAAMVKKAMMYPMVLIFAIIGVIIIMLMVVIPSYTDMFNELGADLPMITQIMVAASDFLKANWPILLAIVIGVVLVIKAYAKTNSGKHVFGKLALTIPAMKNMKMKEASSMMARTTSTLIAAGVPLVEAVGIVSNTMTNVWYKDALVDCKEQITMGVPLSMTLETTKLFPPMVYHMTHIGEEAGNTEEMLEKLADYYDEEVEMAVQTLMAALEPMITIVMAIVVGVMIYGIMAPMMSLFNAIK